MRNIHAYVTILQKIHKIRNFSLLSVDDITNQTWWRKLAGLESLRCIIDDGSSKDRKAIGSDSPPPFKFLVAISPWIYTDLTL